MEAGLLARDGRLLRAKGFLLAQACIRKIHVEILAEEMPVGSKRRRDLSPKLPRLRYALDPAPLFERI